MEVSTLTKLSLLIWLSTNTCFTFTVVNCDRSSSRKFDTRPAGFREDIPRSIIKGGDEQSVDFDPVSDLEDDSFSNSRSRLNTLSSSKIKKDYSAIRQMHLGESAAGPIPASRDRDMAAAAVADDPDEETDSTGCPKKFGGRCECKTFPETDNRMNRAHETTESKFVVKCKNTGFTDSAVLSYLPYFTDELIFTGNKIPNLPPNLFGRSSDFPNLKKIDLSDNEIITIDGKAFHHVSSVERLILNHNNLSNASLHEHPRVFSNFINLKELYLTNAFNDKIWNLADLYEIFIESNLTQVIKIHLEQNELEFINNKDLFCSLPSLTQIYMAQNNLSDLNLNIQCLKNIQIIDLRENNIRTINEDSALWDLLGQNNSIGEPIRIELLNNKINCDCNSQSFITWLQKMQLKNPDIVRDLEALECYDGLPKNNKGLHVRAVDETECPVIKSSYASYSSLASALSWILIIIVVLVLICVLYINRTFIYRFINVRPCLIPMRAQHAGYSAYTSIDKTEESEIAHV